MDVPCGHLPIMNRSIDESFNKCELKNNTSSIDLIPPCHRAERLCHVGSQFLRIVWHKVFDTSLFAKHSQNSFRGSEIFIPRALLELAGLYAIILRGQECVA
jgi:hypothetical protein